MDDNAGLKIKQQSLAPLAAGARAAKVAENSKQAVHTLSAVPASSLVMVDNTGLKRSNRSSLP